jgi:hypothetical protein
MQASRARLRWEDDGMPPDPEPDRLTPAARGPAPASRPVFAVRSREDTDVGWGEQPDTEQPDSEDHRLAQERPPHWEPS